MLCVSSVSDLTLAAGESAGNVLPVSQFFIRMEVPFLPRCRPDFKALITWFNQLC